MDFAVIATGQSLTLQQVAEVAHLRRVMVSNAYALAMDAEAMVSVDASWWRQYPDAHGFPGMKYTLGIVEGVERLRGYPTVTNSGLMGMRIAAARGATRIILLGFDMHGSHYFGPHANGLANTSEDRFRIHRDQFKGWPGPPVVNCSPGSALTCFPQSSLEAILCSPPSRAAAPARTNSNCEA